MSCDQLQGQTEDSLQQHLMNLLSDKASYEAAAKVQLDIPDRLLWLLQLVCCIHDSLSITRQRLWSVV